ncbi:hypothetical protein ACEYYA_02225 [Paracoccus sp. p3-h83]|uniref:hypothetical protein n=1 Tax=Paracoccus sp. p3-h83 TaxID=3342805 RepID=UPI0035B763DF
MIVASFQVAAASAFLAVWSWMAFHGLPGGPTYPLDLSAFARPFSALSVLTFVVAVLILLKSALRLCRVLRVGAQPASVALPLSFALITGGLWPLILHPAPALATALAGLQVVLALRVLAQSHRALQSPRRSPVLRLTQMSRRIARLRFLSIAPVALFAGWSIAVTGSMMAVTLKDPIGIAPGAAVAVALLAIALLALGTQLAAHRTPELSLSVIWALIGTAATQIGLPGHETLPVTLMAVAGISLLAAGIVRVST